MKRVSLERLPTGRDVQAALARFVRAARGRVEVRRLIVFGSAARGEMGPDSDVDVLVVWSGPEAEGRKALVAVTSRIFLETGVDISPRVVGPGHFAQMKALETAFYQNVEREGLVVAG